MDNVLHLYPGESFHSDGFVVGDKSALLRLRAAIDKALETGMEVAPVYVIDGEGYNCIVICTDEPNLVVPYTAEDALLGSGCQEQKKWPYELVDHEKREVLSKEAWERVQR